MRDKPQYAVVVIGDLIDSKKIKNRSEFQQKFVKDLENLNEWQAESPYTLTLGDEFQALYTDSRGLFYDLFHIRECIHPVRCRFSLAIGEVNTSINHVRAIGMDGPAFHIARKGIEHLRKTGNQLLLGGLPEDIDVFIRPAFNILWACSENWNLNRLKIMRMELEQNWDIPEKYDLHITERAINKNIREARLSDWARLIECAEKQVNQLIHG